VAGNESRKGNTETPNTLLSMPKLCAKGRWGMHGTNLQLIILRCRVCGKWVALRVDPDDVLKQIAAYLGLVPLEDSSGKRRRLGHITKQGSSMLRFLMVEAAQVTVRSLPEWRSKYFHLMMRRGRKIAKVAMARRLAIGLYWMWRKGWDYEQVKKFGSHAGQLGTGDGVQ
jgi:Transposase IS116/IS110/IS902 family